MPARNSLDQIVWSSKSPPSMWVAPSDNSPGERKWNMETSLPACLPFLLASSSVLLLHSSSNLRTSFFGFPSGSSPGILLALSARLGLQRHEASWTEQLADSQPLCFWADYRWTTRTTSYKQYQCVPYGTLATASAFLFLANPTSLFSRNGSVLQLDTYSCKSCSVNFSTVIGSNPNDPVILLWGGSASH